MTSADSSRLPLVDVARGGAVALMVIYHFCWDLSFFRLAGFDLLNDPFWLALRTAILGSFLMLVGIGLVLAAERGFQAPAFFRRLARLAAAALAISAVSYAMFPESPIFFGVLHHIAVASALGLLFVRLPAPVTALLGGAALLAPAWLADPWFDLPAWRWVGLVTREPTSNDFVPVLPWFGVVLWGIAAGRSLRHWPRLRAALARPPSGRLGRALRWGGRHSLALYLLHQPILMGLLYAVTTAAGLAPPSQDQQFLSHCEASCRHSGGVEAMCPSYCRCVMDDLRQAGLWREFLASRLDEAGRDQLMDSVDRCTAAAAPPPAR